MNLQEYEAMEELGMELIANAFRMFEDKLLNEKGVEDVYFTKAERNNDE